MKKAISILLCTFLLLVLTSCGARNESEDLLTEDDVKSTVSFSEAIEAFSKEKEAIERAKAEEEQEKATERAKAEEELLYKKIKEYYLSGEWDGSPIMMDGHTVERSRSSGYITLDGYLCASHQEYLDLPESLDYDSFDSNLWYVPYLGTAVIDNQTLKMYVRGELITLPGGQLVYEGIDLTSYTPIEYFLRPYEEYNKLFLVVSAVPNNLIMEYGIEYFSNLYLYDFSFEETKKFDGIRRYLYIFPDPSVSKVKLISEFKEWYIYGSSSSDDEWYYIDTSDTWWEYQNSVENYGFVKVGQCPWN
ncbi:MAG: hypothetical protein K2H53_04375 [Clostridia bacterium]|nr:hypothetical protein [Clostridia bacterium]